MKKFTYIIIFILCLFNSSQEAIAQKVNGCGYIVPPRSMTQSFQSVYEAKEVVTSLLGKINWQNENFFIQQQNGIRNAYATISRGQRLIIYDNAFLEDVDAYAKTKWASISVMAHEVGHHYYNHVVSSQGSTVPTEIEADAFSGYVLQKEGATLPESLAAINAIASDRQSATHPAKTDRIAAITRGWNAAKANTAPSTANTGSNTPPVKTPTNTNPNNNPNSDPNVDPSWIGITVQSLQDEVILLSDDGKKFEQVTIKAGQPFIVKFEIYQYGFLRLPYFNGYRNFKLFHGKDYGILYNRRTKNWTVVEIPM